MRKALLLFFVLICVAYSYVAHAAGSVLFCCKNAADTTKYEPKKIRALSSDGSKIVALNGDKIELLDRQKNVVLGSLNNQPKFFAFAVSPNGKFLAGGSINGFVNIVRFDTEQTIYSMGHCSGLGCTTTALAFSPDSKFLVFAYGNGDSIDVINIETLEVKSFLKTSHANSIICALAFSSNGKYLVSGDDTGRIEVWDIASRNSIMTVKILPVCIDSLAFSCNSTVLAVMGEASSGKIKLNVIDFFDINSMLELYNTIDSADIMRDSKIREKAITNGTVLNYDSSGACAFSPDDKIVIGCGSILCNKSYHEEIAAPEVKASDEK